MLTGTEYDFGECQDCGKPIMPGAVLCRPCLEIDESGASPRSLDIADDLAHEGRGRR